MTIYLIKETADRDPAAFVTIETSLAKAKEKAELFHTESHGTRHYRIIAEEEVYATTDEPASKLRSDIRDCIDEAVRHVAVVPWSARDAIAAAIIKRFDIK